jgi:hypothetical protein
LENKNPMNKDIPQNLLTQPDFGFLPLFFSILETGTKAAIINFIRSSGLWSQQDGSSGLLSFSIGPWSFSMAAEKR